MKLDIEFYDLNRELIYILPSSSVGRGYISANVTESFQKVGKFEITLIDDKLTSLLQNYPNGLFIKWNGFDGYMTDYQITMKKTKIFGTCLKGLLSKVVVMPISNGAQENIRPHYHMQYAFTSIKKRATWLDYDARVIENTFPDRVKMTVGDLITASDYMQQLSERVGGGYRVYYGTDNKYHIVLVKTQTNNMILSQHNRNVEDVQIDFDLKTNASGGWFMYTNDNDVIVTESVGTLATSIDKREIVLDADNASTARIELASKQNTVTVSCKANRVEYGVDYNLGDLVRVQTNDGTLYDKQVVTTVQRWHEGSAYHEEPSFESVENITKSEVDEI